MHPPTAPELWPYMVIPLGFAGFWLFLNLVLTLVAWLGGWRRLAAAYPGRPQAEGGVWRFRSLRLGGWTRYNNAVTLGGDREGLHLTMPWFFGGGHPPIFIPWSEMSVAGKHDGFGLFPTVSLVFKRCPDVPLSLSARLLAEIQAGVKALAPQGGGSHGSL